jgi:mortality factor 4-like protein 1
MPDRLKSLLVDDWENITKNLQLVQLPSVKPASVILDEFHEAQRAQRQMGSIELEILEEVIQGLKEYFNKSLGRLLLYRFERQQFFDIHSRVESPTSDLAGKAFCDIYGGEHLLRLFGMFTNVSRLKTVLLILDSLYARAHRADQHGPPGNRPSEGGTDQHAPMAI